MLEARTLVLSNGVEIPQIGLGTWLLNDEQAARAVEDALAMGYRHIDTAQTYGNERGIGEGLRASGIAREEVFVTTKVAAECKTYESAAASIDESLAKLGFDFTISDEGMEGLKHLDRISDYGAHSFSRCSAASCRKDEK